MKRFVSVLVVLCLLPYSTAALPSGEVNQEMQDLKKALEAIRLQQADQGADATELRELIKALTGKVEALQNAVSSLDKKMNGLQERISRIEASRSAAENGKKPADQIDTSLAEETDIDETGDPETDYETALGYFREENYHQARGAFQKYLERYPDGEQAVEAQYRIAECLYHTDDYERAVLEYEKAIRQAPGGDHVPDALLKQGLSFFKLGDPATAKLLFQQLIAQYPDSIFAEMAEKKLEDIP